MTDKRSYALPSQGHECPDALTYRAGVDDLCDLPEPWRRLAYTLNISSQHACTEGHGHSPDFCKHALWREIVAMFRAAHNGGSQ